MNDNVKHTPGPWSRNIKPAKKYNTIFAGQNTHIAHLATSGLTDNEVEANCNLIAAAPEMLEALESIYGDLDAVMPTELVKHFGASRNMIRAAIAKATGKGE